MAKITVISTTESETPLRSVLSNARGITGIVSTARCGSISYEFPVERDFLERLDFNPRVRLIRAQSVRIHFLDGDGGRRRYTSDFYVEYDQRIGERPWHPRLFEVKTVEDLRADIEDLRPKLKAAALVCKERRWLFRIATDRVIRNIRGTNVPFLRKYRAIADPHGYGEKLLDHLHKKPPMTVMGLLDAVTPNVEDRLAAIPVLWRLIAIQHVRAELSRPLNMASTIWANGDGPSR